VRSSNVAGEELFVLR